TIKAQNRQGIKPEALETVEIVSEKPKEVEPEFVDVVGQITLKSLEKNNKKRKSHGKKNQENKQNVSKGISNHNHKHKPSHSRRNSHNKDRNPPKN
ncbi:MAG TPA: hypothetical protein VFF23_12670, partial [Hanamia sp.]|nr:hypothetical protein [Hanamia sp.]